MCLTEAELPPGPNDVQLGTIADTPFVIDVAPGAAGSFSLEGADGVHFVSRTPQTTP